MLPPRPRRRGKRPRRPPPLLLLLVFSLLLRRFSTSDDDDDSFDLTSSLATRYDVDEQIFLGGFHQHTRQVKFSFPRLPALFPRLEPASASAEKSFHSLRALTIDPETQRIFWAVEPCESAAAAKPASATESSWARFYSTKKAASASSSSSAAGPTTCLSSVTSVQLLLQALSEPSCKPGIGFTLDPDDPKRPLGTHFRKTFLPAECADLWSDLLPGAVLFEADWDLKMLLHNVDEVAAGLGPWYRTIEELCRVFPPPLGEEVLGKVWLVAESVQVQESAHGIAFGHVTLRLHGAAMERDKEAPTGLTEMEGPPPPALAAFVTLGNRHMEELVAHFPSFQYLQQLVLAQEAARFLAHRQIDLPMEAGLAALRSPMTNQKKVPALHLERKRLLTWAGHVQLNKTDGAILHLAGEVPLGIGVQGLILADPGSSSNLFKPRQYSCSIRNGTTGDLRHMHALFSSTSNASLDCRLERTSGFSPWGDHHRRKSKHSEEEDEDDENDGRSKSREAADFDWCPDGMAVWSSDAEEWRVWVSQSPVLGGSSNSCSSKGQEGEEGVGEEDERHGEREGEGEEEGEGEGPPPQERETEDPTRLLPLEQFNVTGRMVLLEEMDEISSCDASRDDTHTDTGTCLADNSAVILLAAEEDRELEHAIGKLQPVGVLLIQSEEARQRRRRAAAAAEEKEAKRRKMEKRRSSSSKSDGRANTEKEKNRKKKDKKKQQHSPKAAFSEQDLLPPFLRHLPLRYVTEDVARDLRLAMRRDDGELWLWLACGVEREKASVGGEKGEGEEAAADAHDAAAGYRTVTYEGVTYRTLDLAVVDSMQAGCQTLPLSLPEGYEMAPSYDHVVEEVVKHHTWGTSFILLRATVDDENVLVMPPTFAAYSTAIHPGGEGERLDAMGTDLVKVKRDNETRQLTYQPRECAARILIRTVVTTLTYAGYIYRALESNVPVDMLDVPTEKTGPVFKGVEEVGFPTDDDDGEWEVAPVNRAVAQKVVGGHCWGTDALLLSDGKAYPTLLFFHRKALVQSQGVAFNMQHRVLIRRRLSGGGEDEGDGDVDGEQGEDGQWEREDGVEGVEEEEGAAHTPREEAREDYRMGDMYRADASAWLDFRRLAVEDVGYLLEMEVTERVMIHGGVDLTGVRRVDFPGPVAGVRDGDGESGGSSDMDSSQQAARRRDGLLEALDRNVKVGGEGGEVLTKELSEEEGESTKRYNVFST